MEACNLAFSEYNVLTGSSGRDYALTECTCFQRIYAENILLQQLQHVGYTSTYWIH